MNDLKTGSIRDADVAWYLANIEERISSYLELAVLTGETCNTSAWHFIHQFPVNSLSKSRAAAVLCRRL